MRMPAGVDIAIVGMGVRFAGASSPDEFWSLLARGGRYTGAYMFE